VPDHAPLATHFVDPGELQSIVVSPSYATARGDASSESGVDVCCGSELVPVVAVDGAAAVSVATVTVGVGCSISNADTAAACTGVAAGTDSPGTTFTNTLRSTEPP
jgi:hypothetical protein